MLLSGPASEFLDVEEVRKLAHSVKSSISGSVITFSYFSGIISE
jgi:hypothetical protein